MTVILVVFDIKSACWMLFYNLKNMKNSVLDRMENFCVNASCGTSFFGTSHHFLTSELGVTLTVTFHWHDNSVTIII
jgi:hypothetical protein